jgi:hypothetical protein
MTPWACDAPRASAIWIAIAIARAGANGASRAMMSERARPSRYYIAK